MSAVSFRAQRLATRLAVAARRIAELPDCETPAWAAPARDAALARLAALGLPEKRDEYWRYTDPDRLTASDVRPAEVFRITDERPMYEGIDRLRLVFVDGVFDPAQSDPIAGEGFELSRLSEAAQIHWAADLFGTLEAAGQSPVPRPLAALNTATAREGVLIRVTGRVTRPVSLIYRRESETADVALHHVLRLEPGAELTLLENGPVGARSSIVIEAELGDGAQLHHVRTMGRDHQRKGITHLFARLGAGARMKSFTLSMNGRLVRNEVMVWLTGEGAVAHVAGAALGDGVFHHDDTVFIHHQAPGCESRQVFKKVLHHGAIGVFQGKILVDAVAQKTDGYQISQSLMLDDDCQFLAKPALEIYADDVKCSHGSTSGEIDRTHLFYLRSRGIPEDEAKRLLVLSFLAEALAEIDRPDIAEDMHLRLRRWLGKRS